MKKHSVSAAILALTLLLLVSGTALAYVLRAQVAITESNGIPYDMIGVSWNASNTFLVDNGFLPSTGNTSRVQTLAGTNKPHSVATDRTLTATAIDADSQTNLYFVTGESEQETFQIIPGYSNNSSVGYVETPDNTTTEIGDNGSVSAGSAYPVSSADIFRKNGGIGAYYDATSENISTFTGYWNDNFSIDNWVDVGDKISVNTTASRLDYDALRGDGDDRCYRDIDAASNTTWKLEFTWTPTSSPVYDGNLLVFGLWDRNDQNYDSITGDAILMFQSENLTTLRHINDGVTGANADNISITLGTTYYVTLERTSSTNITLHLYSDSVRATEVAGSPISAAVSSGIVNLDVIQGSNFAGAGLTGENIGWIDDVRLYNEELATITGVEQGEYDTLEFERDKPFNSLGVDASSFDTPYSTNLTYNLPFRQSEFNTYGANFTSIDDFEHECDPVNAVWSITGYSFDGAGDYIGLPASTINTTEGTFIFWVYFDRDDTAEYLFSSNSDELSIYHNTSNELRMYYDTVQEINTNLLTAYGAYTGQWLHIAFTYLEGSNGYCYINGVEVTHDTSINAGGFTPAATAIGSRSDHAHPLQGDIGEFLFYDKQLTQAQIAQHYNATRYHFTTGDIATVSSLASIPDTSANWTFFNDNSVAYADNITISVNGTQRLWYAPNTIINSDGTTGNLTDRSGNGNTGIIRWGSNPVGIVTALGSFTSSGQPTVGSSTTTPTEDILPPAGGDWDVEPAVSGALLTNPLRSIVVAISDNTTLTEMQTWRWLGVALVVLVTGATAVSVRGHQGITGIALGVALALVTAMTIFPPWTYAFVAVFVVGGIIAERKPSL